MNISFWKMHACSNDFILIDAHSRQLDSFSSDRVKEMCLRHRGIGSDGLILIQPSQGADFKMSFYNPDGTEANMCGNGARCAARLAYDLHIAPPHMTIETQAGVIHAEIVSKDVLLYLPAPCDWRLTRTLKLSGDIIHYSFVNIGVPHVVVETVDLRQVDVSKLGAEIRHHKEFAPEGTNVNFMKVTGLHSFELRTYERGVEGETFSCGTGIAACGVIAGRLGKVDSPVQVKCAGSDTVSLNFKITERGAENVTLQSPALYVFKGSSL